MKEVYVAKDPVDAQFVCEMLAQEGIDAVVRADPMPVTTRPYPTVCVVHDADAERARWLVDEMGARDGSGGS